MPLSADNRSAAAGEPIHPSVAGVHRPADFWLDSASWLAGTGGACRHGVHSSGARAPNGPRPLSGPQALPFFSEQILKCHIVQGEIGHHPFQLGIFFFEAFQLPRVTDLQTAVLGFPLIKSRLAHSMLPT